MIIHERIESIAQTDEKWGVRNHCIHGSTMPARGGLHFKSHNGVMWEYGVAAARCAAATISARHIEKDWDSLNRSYYVFH